MMLGLLLARAGIDVIVLEKHRDFLRDFRGDTIHPSTLEIMYELGVLEAFLNLPHDEVREIDAYVEGTRVPFADFTHLPTRCRFLALMPQWNFLDFLAANARRHRGFALRMQAEVNDLLVRSGEVHGLIATTPEGRLEVAADLVIGADGRRSTVRERAGLSADEFGAPLDVLWFRLSRGDDERAATAGYVSDGHILVMLNRGSYWQCGLVIAKGAFVRLRAAGLPALRERIARLAPPAAGSAHELTGWDAVSLLTVQVDRLRQWYQPGLLCIGDAAHAMSPVGGVGINLAIQDAVATSNLLTPALRSGRPGLAELQRLQRRRELPTRMTQRFQMEIHKRVIARVLAHAGDGGTLPWPLRQLQRHPLLRRIPARLLGVGFRPEHVRATRDDCQPRHNPAL